MSAAAADAPPPPSGEDWPARIEQLLGEAEARAVRRASASTVLCRVAEIYERRLNDPNGALVTLQAALEQDPTSGRVVQEMERVARSSGCWNELIAITAEVASGLDDPKQSADLWVQIAFWDESGLGLPEEAANAARAALNLAPDATAARWRCSRICTGGSAAGIATSRSWRASTSSRTTIRTSCIEAYREVLRYEPQHVGALDGRWRASREETRRLGAGGRYAAQADRRAAARTWRRSGCWRATAWARS